MTEPALRKSIYHFGRPATMACDGNCRKAWGVSKRPSHPLPDARDEDDDEFLADGELPDAPEDPGTYEGDHAKPTRLDQRLNKWCLRECERSAWADGHDREFLLDDHSERIPNRYDRKSERQMAAVRSRGRHATTADPAETAPDLRARLEAAERRADEAEARLRELDAAAFDAMLATAYGAPACIFGELGAMTVRGLARMQTLDSDVQRY
ncbi:MAG: hypothetical protein Q8Q14_05340, partial [Gemmatimonadales bacterium]|nr:hypothetical protein [Gemmatimonadales bacterium]